MDQPENLKQALVYQPSLLSFKSYSNYRRLEDAIRDHINPRDILEEIWTSEIVAAEWEIARLRRYKDQIVVSARIAALRSLLQLACADAGDDDIEDLAKRWFTNKSVRKQIRAMLGGIGLDQAAIEVEAYRLSMADLTAIERRLTELALRRDKIFRQIEDYRAGLSAPAGSGSRQPIGRDIGVARGGEA